MTDAIVTVFADRSAQAAREMPLAKLEEILRDPPARPDKKSCELFVCARFGAARTAENSLRSNDNVLDVCAIVGDYDGELVGMDTAREKLQVHGVKATFYTSPSHTPSKPRWRVLAPLSVPHPKDRHSRLAARLNAALGGILANESRTLSQPWYFGRVNGHEYAHAESAGRPLDLLSELDDLLPGDDVPAGGGAVASATESDAELRSRVVEGARGEVYLALRSLAARLVGRGMPPDDVTAALLGLLDQCAWKERDPSTWQQRRDGIPTLVASAAKKYADPRAPADKADPLVIGGAFALATARPEAKFVLRPALMQGKVITLTGHPGHGKSTVAMAMAFALALNRQVGALVPEIPGRTYYVSAEDEDGTQKRIFAEGVRHKLTPELRADVDTRLRWVNEIELLLSPALLAEYIKADAGEQPLSAIFIDTGPALFPGDDENANAQMQRFAASCQVLAKLPGMPCVVVFWHPVKNATEENLVPRGGSSLLGAVDGNLAVWLDEEARTTTLRHTTKWRGPHFEPIQFVLDPIALEMPSGARVNMPIAVPQTTTRRERADGPNARESILLRMWDDGRKPVLSVRALAAAVNKSPSTVGDHLKHLSREKLVKKDPLHDDRYALTGTGERKARELTAVYDDASEI